MLVTRLMRIRLLLVDSDETTCKYLACLLSEYGYECTCAYNGLQALQILEKNPVNLVIMDHQLPDMGGFHLLKQILILQNIQIVMLSRDDSEHNRVRALESGATDFVAKPLMYPTEFLWRIRAILKRSMKQQIILSRVQINLIDRIVRCDGLQINLTSQLFQFLVTLASRPGQVVEHDHLLYALEDDYRSSSNNILYVLAHRLRQYMEHNSDKPRLICTVRGVGYLLNDS